MCHWCVIHLTHLLRYCCTILLFCASGGENDLIARIRACEYFAPIHARLDALMDPNTFIGCAPEQVRAFVDEEVVPALSPYASALDGAASLNV